MQQLLQTDPCAVVCLQAGLQAYENGAYTSALELLQQSYNLAAAEGYGNILLESRLFMGNCCSNMLQYQPMKQHYAVARNLAQSMGKTQVLRDIAYNIASTALEMGDAREAYRFFSNLESPGVMDLHKLAICCEKLGKPRQALQAIESAMSQDCAYPPRDLCGLMCGVVLYRLQNDNYLHSDEYGKLLQDCFAQIKQRLPSGYAGFHLPYLLQYQIANRCYKQAYDLMCSFPAAAQIALQTQNGELSANFPVSSD